MNKEATGFFAHAGKKPQKAADKKNNDTIHSAN